MVSRRMKLPNRDILLCGGPLDGQIKQNILSLRLDVAAWGWEGYYDVKPYEGLALWVGHRTKTEDK